MKGNNFPGNKQVYNERKMREKPKHGRVINVDINIKISLNR